MDELHPTNWTCPSCKTRHSKPHWPDHHQKEPGWKDKLGPHYDDKESNPDFRVVCEVCGTALTEKPSKRPRLKPKKDYCPTCREKRQGILAPLLCPHCGWTQERLVLVRAG